MSVRALLLALSIGAMLSAGAFGGSRPAAAQSLLEQEKIAFMRRAGTSSWDLWVMNADGTGQTRLVSGDSTSWPGQPAWSPDGTKIAFDRSGDIWVMDADGSGLTQVTSTPSTIETAPSWSPDGDRLAVVAVGAGISGYPNRAVVVMNADGSNPSQLTTGVDATTPSWSPGGAKIAFTAGYVSIHVINADGTNLTTLTPGRDPTWSPDGTKLAFSAAAPFTDEIHVIDADGTDLTTLTPPSDGWNDFYPSWSPDGSRLVFVGTASGGGRLFAIAADGSGRTQLTDGTTLDTFPRWQPIPGAPPELDFDWTVPERYGEDGNGDGLRDSFPPDANGDLEIEPDGWRVDFDADQEGEPCDTALERTWLLDGVDIEADDPHVIAYDPHACDFSYRFDEEGTYPISLEVKDGNGNVKGFVTKDVVVQDWLIVSIGDSVASGEGNPDVPILPLWQNRQCHRSALAGPARAALAVEDADPRTSVTFVHLACSGATTMEGLIGPYEGQEPGAFLPPQVEELERLAGGREIDALLVSIGANDVHFSKVVEKCVLFADCDVVSPGSAARFFAKDLEGLPDGYNALAYDLADRGIAADRVYLTEYFDPTRDDQGGYCDETILADHPFAKKIGRVITATEAAWASNTMMLSLNAAGAAAAARHGWNRVGGIRDPFLTHGYCANDHWVVQYAESMARQDNQDGTLHPNAPGHALYGQRIAAELTADLYPGGDLDSPREPAEAAG